MRYPDQQATPGLAIYAPAHNIGGEQVAALGDKLTGRRKHPASPKDVRRVLKPAGSPRANIAFSEETANLHEFLGMDKVDRAHLEDLRSYMRSVLRVHLGEGSVGWFDTLPPRIDELEDGSLSLSVAGSEDLISARALAKAAYGSYYRVRKIPEEVWLPGGDEVLTGVELARSSGPSTHDLVRRLYVELNSDDTILEPRTELGNLLLIPDTLLAGEGDTAA